MKKKFLIFYDYGMGGLWAIISAKSEKEIIQKYPKINVTMRPSWMSDEDYSNIILTDSYDIDDEPRGWLAKLDK